MNLKHPTTTTTTTTTPTAADSADTNGETPLHSHLIKPFSSFNRKNHHHQPPPPVVAYKECLKNHAATIGSHALDGCGEFMPSLTAAPHEQPTSLKCPAAHEHPTSLKCAGPHDHLKCAAPHEQPISLKCAAPTESASLKCAAPHEQPTSLKCAACGCHRNFHRRELINDVYAYNYQPHLLLSFDQNPMVTISPGTPAEIKIENPNGRKRFRSKFSQDQKEKMYLFGEKVGWKMQRCDDKLVNDFCNEVGIKRGIFKVWMHNNKNTFGKKDKETSSPTTTAAGRVAGGVSATSMDIYDNGRVISRVSNSSDQENGGGCGGSGGCDGVGGCGEDAHRHASNNGSSSSC